MQIPATKFIAHRGNLNGSNSKEENSISYILEALRLGLDVEIDVRYVDDKLYLGHDEIQEEIDLNFLFIYHDKLWIHCKTIETLQYLRFCHTDRVIQSQYSKYLNFFFHDRDFATLTSRNYIWIHPLAIGNFNSYAYVDSIIVLPENGNMKYEEITKFYGACTDIPMRYIND